MFAKHDAYYEIYAAAFSVYGDIGDMQIFCAAGTRGFLGRINPIGRSYYRRKVVN